MGLYVCGGASGTRNLMNKSNLQQQSAIDSLKRLLDGMSQDDLLQAQSLVASALLACQAAPESEHNISSDNISYDNADGTPNAPDPTSSQTKATPAHPPPELATELNDDQQCDTSELSEPKGRDRRRHRRFEVSLPGTLRRLGTTVDENMTIPVRVVDVSKGGVRFVAPASHPPGPISELSFRTPSRRIRTVYVRSVRLWQLNSGGGEELQLAIGAESLDPNQARNAVARLRELRRLRESIHQRVGLRIVLVGDAGSTTNSLGTAFAEAGYRVARYERIESLAAIAQRDAPAAIIYLNAQQILACGEVAEQIADVCPMVTQVGVTNDEIEAASLGALGLIVADEVFRPDALVRQVSSHLRMAVVGKMCYDLPDVPNILIWVPVEMDTIETGLTPGDGYYRPMVVHDMQTLSNLLRLATFDALIVPSMLIKGRPDFGINELIDLAGATRVAVLTKNQDESDMFRSQAPVLALTGRISPVQIVRALDLPCRNSK